MRNTDKSNENELTLKICIPFNVQLGLSDCLAPTARPISSTQLAPSRQTLWPPLPSSFQPPHRCIFIPPPSFSLYLKESGIFLFLFKDNHTSCAQDLTLNPWICFHPLESRGGAGGGAVCRNSTDSGRNTELHGRRPGWKSQLCSSLCALGQVISPRQISLSLSRKWRRWARTSLWHLPGLIFCHCQHSSSLSSLSAFLHWLLLLCVKTRGKLFSLLISRPTKLL